MLGFIKEESFASSMGMIFIREKSSTFLLGMMLDVFWSIGEESSTSSIRIVCLMCLNHWGRVFCFPTKDNVLDVLDLLGNNSCFLTEDNVLDVLDPLGMVSRCICFIGWRVFYFLYRSLGSPLIILGLIGAIWDVLSFFERRKVFFF